MPSVEESFEILRDAGRRGWYGFLLPQLGAWIAMGVVYFAIETHQVTPPDRLNDLLDASAWAGSGAALATVLCLAYGRVRLDRLTRWRFAPIAVVSSIVVSCLWFVAHNELNGLLEFSPGYRTTSAMTPTFLFHGIESRVILFFLWHAAGILRIQGELSRIEEERAARLEKVLLEARIARLRGQLNPHFLFNALTSVLARIDEDKEAAKGMIRSFARLLRDTLDDSSQGISTIGREVELVTRYLEIESARFEENLRLVERVDEGLSEEPLPPFLLLPLVENAIKHGMRTSEMPLEVELSATREGGTIVLGVSNTGRLDAPVGADEEEDAPHGIANLRKRLAMELGPRCSFTLHEEGGRVKAWLRIARSPSSPSQKAGR